MTGPIKLEMPRRTSPSRRGRRGYLVAVLAVFAATGCGAGLLTSEEDQAYHEAGRNLIEGTLASEIGIGPLVAVCEGRDLGPGSVMACTATPTASSAASEVGPIEFEGRIRGDGATVDVVSTNLLLAGQVEQVEAFAATVLTPRLGWSVRAEDVECANGPVVVTSGDTMNCVLTGPNDVRQRAAITIEDFASLTITVAVDPPIEDELGSAES